MEYYNNGQIHLLSPVRDQEMAEEIERILGVTDCAEEGSQELDIIEENGADGDMNPALCDLAKYLTGEGIGIDPDPSVTYVRYYGNDDGYEVYDPGKREFISLDDEAYGKWQSSPGRAITRLLAEAPIGKLERSRLEWRQIRALLTAECIINDIKVDTAQWDRWVGEIAELSGYDGNVENLDAFLCADLV